MVAEVLRDRIAQGHDPRGQVRPVQDAFGDRLAFGGVRVEEGLPGGPLEDQGKLPGEVVGVLNARVQPLAAGRAVDVRRVSRDEAAADAELGDDPAVEPEERDPGRVVDDRPLRPVRVEDGLDLLQGGAGSSVVTVPLVSTTRQWPGSGKGKAPRTPPGIRNIWASSSGRSQSSRTSARKKVSGYSAPSNGRPSWCRTTLCAASQPMSQPTRTV